MSELISARRHGHLGYGGNLVGITADAREEDGVSQDIGTGSAKLDFGRGNVKVVLSKAFKKGYDIGEVGREVWVQTYDVVEAGVYAIKVINETGLMP